MKVAWKYVLTESGEQSVMICGEVQMPKWHVHNLASLEQVTHFPLSMSEPCVY